MKRYIIKTQNGYLQEYIRATSFVAYTTDRKDALTLSHVKALEYTRSLIVALGDLDKVVMVEVA
jgi:hypothetical protein